ncbi:MULTISPECIES: flagellar FlbD family protein [unclassified Fusibacter]|uniref:flagellar FlbD family protein n=1 Tax=unclassified Fusibacter TaxID=2624464 RepID=UPI001011A782|nr:MULTISPECIES: flagellar FlbD family protein [unclassified Fusibacter]MCK8058764.1 flagellar FlbD family protein [Fusibacter sp. A2]NPE21838.1 flagellar FlbD family protein [Fusibacter sp. A1]RXV61410.1 flagellar protein FlbD [Fusibacter sp. A1]
MIKVSRLNGKEFIVNCDLIEFIESTPDTVITLSTDKKIIVSESIDEVIERIVQYKQKTSILPSSGLIYRDEV